MFQYFFETKDTIPKGVGFEPFDATHMFWLVLLVILAVTGCLIYRRLDEKRRKIFRIVLASLIVADELYKIIGLLAIGKYTAGYLPLHLCSINVFIIAIHAFKPYRVLDNFLYTVCIPASLAALLLPNWTKLPLLNFMHIHSSTVHILLLLYPLILTVCGDIKPCFRDLPKSLALLLGFAIPIYGVNVWLGKNFMFLMKPDGIAPLVFFENLWGNHLYGYPVLITAIVAVMYAPWLIAYWVQKKRKKSAALAH
ncbi:MAG: YwaF family protein [Clostridia bacterium]|nr:YwaF family protein [Clostridia bacterium]